MLCSLCKKQRHDAASCWSREDHDQGPHKRREQRQVDVFQILENKTAGLKHLEELNAIK